VRYSDADYASLVAAVVTGTLNDFDAATRLIESDS